MMTSVLVLSSQQSKQCKGFGFTDNVIGKAGNKERCFLFCFQLIFSTLMQQH